MLSELGKKPGTEGGSSLQRIAAIAGKLGEAELKVLLVLASDAESNHHHTTRASSRELAKRTGIARSNVVKAIDSLVKQRILTLRDGTATKASGYIVHALDTVLLGGPFSGPPPVVSQQDLDLSQDHPVVLSRYQSGPFSGPPPTPGQGEHSARARVDFDLKTDLIDRLLKATAKDFPPDRIREASKAIHGYQAKFAREKNPHPPEDRIVAQFLAVAPWPQLDRLLYDLMAERQEAGYSYAWFVTVALQRIHGVKPETLKQRRAELKIVGKDSPTDGKEYASNLLAQVVQSKQGGLR